MRSSVLLLLSCFLVLSSCRDGLSKPEAVDARIVYDAKFQCKVQNVGFAKVEDIDQLFQQEAFERHVFPASATHHFFLLSLGTYPTPGYGVRLLEKALTTVDSSAELRLQWTSPMPGLMQAQMTTTPCYLFALPKLGYQRVKVVDKEGKLRYEYTLR